MTIRKSALAVAIALACSSAHALQEIPLNPSPPDLSLAPPSVSPRAEVAPIANVEVGHVSAGFGLDPVLRKAFVTNYNSGTLSVIDVDTHAVTAVGVGPNPRRMAHNAALHRTYIVNDVSPGTVTVFDAKAGVVLATIPVGNRPRNIAADFQKGEVYVSNLDSNTMSVIATATNEVVATVSVGSQPFMGEVDRTRGLVYVLSQVDRVAHIIDTNTKAVVAQVNTGRQPNGATVDERTGKVYVNNTTDQTITVIDPVSRTVKLVEGTGAGSTFGTISTTFKRYYLPNANDYTITILDTDTDEIVKSVPVDASPQQVSVDAGDANLYVVNRLSNSVSVLDQRSERVLTTLPVGGNPWRVYLGFDRVFALNENGNSLDSVTVATQANTLAGTTLATEWYHAQFDHYFHSADGTENRLLNDGIFGGAWDRTFDAFRVWTEDGPNRAQVCRFFSTAFGTKSSHFYTANVDECAALKAGTDWQFEAMAYWVELPDGGGNCRAGTTQLFRLYNNGMGGAPNHRVTTSAAQRDGLVAKGWIGEGVAACVLSVRGDEL